MLIKGNCLDVIAKMDADSIDVVVADPPYGIGYQSARRSDRNEWMPKIKNDDQPFIDWIHPIFDKMKTGGRLICFYRWDVQDAFLHAIRDAGFTIKSQIVWDKIVHGMGDLKGEFAPCHELMIYATKGRYEFKRGRPKTIYRVQRINGSNLIHPNEKPIKLIADILNDICEPGETVFDPFAGSCSTLLAAKSMGVSCITCELDDYYYEIANDRISREDAKDKISLF